MVFFTCNVCGDSMKKSQVEKHYQTKCRNCSVLSCADCGKDFHGDDYKQHTKCISEAEKYEGKDYQPKTGQNKGEVKQEKWMEQVQRAVEKAKGNPKLSSLLRRLENYSNIPRKQSKFENFVKNSLKVYDNKLVTQVWQFMSEAAAEETSGDLAKVPSEEVDNANGEKIEEKQKNKRERKEERSKKKKEKKHKVAQETNEETVSNNDEDNSVKKYKKNKKKHTDHELIDHSDNDENEHAVKKKSIKNNVDISVENGVNKKKKRKMTDEDKEEHGAVVGFKTARLNDTLEEDDIPKKTAKFDWVDTITQVLEGTGGKELAMKKLRKKVLAQYASWYDGQTHKSDDRLLAKFEKKVTKNPRFKVLKDKVKLCNI